MRKIKLWLFKHYNPDNGHRKYYTDDTIEVPKEWQVWNIVEHIRDNYTNYKGMDIVLVFEPDDEIGYPCMITYQERKHKSE